MCDVQNNLFIITLSLVDICCVTGGSQFSGPYTEVSHGYKPVYIFVSLLR